MNTKVCVVCGSTYSRRANERPAAFAIRKRCGFYCRPVSDRDAVGRAHARVAYPLEPCEVCGIKSTGRRGSVDRHHRNSDRMDNSRDNIAFLCRKHHAEAHRLSDGKVGGGPRPRIVALMRDRAIAQAREAAVFMAAGHGPVWIGREMGVTYGSVRRWQRKYPEVFE